MNVEAVREARMKRARRNAAAVVAEAEAAAAAAVASARDRAARMVAEARTQGAADARVDTGASGAEAARAARAIVLGARSQAYDSLRESAVAAALKFRRDPAYPALLERLQGEARRRLGTGADVEADPPGAGGVRASAAGRHLDLTLRSIAGRAVDALGVRAEELWR